MSQMTVPTPVHCYTNPSFCRQSEYIPSEQNDILPPLQFQGGDLPLPSPPQQPQRQYGQSNLAYQGLPETTYESCNNQKRYCYQEQQPQVQVHKRYSSLPADESQIPYNQIFRNEYTHDVQKKKLQEEGSMRYNLVPHQQMQCSASPTKQNDIRLKLESSRNLEQHTYDILNDENCKDRNLSPTNVKHIPLIRHHLNSPQAGHYTRIPLQEEDLLDLPDCNTHIFSVSSKNNTATQKLYEILATPRKSRSKSVERILTPRKQQAISQGLFTPTNSPSDHASIIIQHETPHGSPQNRSYSLSSPQTSTPTIGPSARRCLPLSEQSTNQRNFRPVSHAAGFHYENAVPNNCAQVGHDVFHSRYIHLEDNPELPPVIAGSLDHPVIPSVQGRNEYQSMRSALTDKTAIVSPMCSPNNNINTTLTSDLEKAEKKNVPLILILVGILTCGLAVYLSWTQGRRYYFDSAVCCGAFCALAGICRSLRRTWTGLGLAGLSALSCAALLLLAARSPRPGSPLHDVTAGALCGVSLIGAMLATLALLTLRCSFSRHRRIHTWIPRLSP